ncbi:hypothetical protein FCM35_KLT15791 [Carex littledalei]|uniref:Uncharacterized protein n=1 Tax=Carex littledalei TaxID=544730 RepID=A0A833VSC8_9POAL|nr:hypothetical protein FCM35_KLT15791 [Carex littledalei]
MVLRKSECLKGVLGKTRPKDTQKKARPKDTKESEAQSGKGMQGPKTPLPDLVNIHAPKDEDECILFTVV